MRPGVRAFRPRAISLLLAAFAGTGTVFGGPTVQLHPAKDGTLVDGGTYGPRDGAADAADWSFNESSFEGSIAVAASPTPFEHRVVWEYSLNSINFDSPVTAWLSFEIRPKAIFPSPPVIDVQVVAYPADLIESLADFERGPEQLLGVARLLVNWVPPQPPPTGQAFTINVSDAVNAARDQGTNAVGFRFQLDAGSAESRQVFIDALDGSENLATKPRLTIEDRAPGDLDENDLVDVGDYAVFEDCLAGPASNRPAGCLPADDNFDSRVDLRDAARFILILGDQF